MKLSEKLRQLSVGDIPDDMSNREYWLKTEIYTLADQAERMEAESKAGARLNIAVRRSDAYEIVRTFYATQIEGGKETFKNDLKLLAPEVSETISGAVLVSDELAALEADDD